MAALRWFVTVIALSFGLALGPWGGWACDGSWECGAGPTDPTPRWMFVVDSAGQTAPVAPELDAEAPTIDSPRAQRGEDR